MELFRGFDRAGTNVLGTFANVSGSVVTNLLRTSFEGSFLAKEIATAFLAGLCFWVQVCFGL